MKLNEYEKLVEEKFDAEMEKRFGKIEARAGVLEASPAVQSLLDKLKATDFGNRPSVAARIVMLLTVAREVTEALIILDARNPQLDIRKHHSDVLSQAKATGTCISVLLLEEAAPPSSASSSSST